MQIPDTHIRSFVVMQYASSVAGVHPRSYPTFILMLYRPENGTFRCLMMIGHAIIDNENLLTIQVSC